MHPTYRIERETSDDDICLALFVDEQRVASAFIDFPTPTVPKQVSVYVYEHQAISPQQAYTLAEALRTLAMYANTEFENLGKPPPAPKETHHPLCSKDYGPRAECSVCKSLDTPRKCENPKDRGDGMCICGFAVEDHG